MLRSRPAHSGGRLSLLPQVCVWGGYGNPLACRLLSSVGLPTSPELKRREEQTFSRQEDISERLAETNSAPWSDQTWDPLGAWGGGGENEIPTSRSVGTFPNSPVGSANIRT